MALATGCTSTQFDCSLNHQEMRVLHERIFAFMEAEGIDTQCEELSKKVTKLTGNAVNVSGKGCAIAGSATNGRNNPRTGVYCPSYLDGGHYIVFDPVEVKPTEITYIRW